MAARERRPATLEDLRVLSRQARSRPWLAPVVGLMLAGVVAVLVATAMSVNTSAAFMPVLVIAVVMAVLAAIVPIVVLVRRARARSQAPVSLLTVDPALAPAVPITEGDRLGGWVVLESSAGRLHVARAQPLASFRVARAGGLLGALGMVAGIVGVATTRVGGHGSVKATDVKLIIAMIAGIAWLVRFALARSAYQWTLETEGGEAELSLQDAALFGASRLLSVRAAQVAGFTATPRELRVVLADGTVRALAGLGGSPLAGWRASCIATTVAVMMGLKTSLTYEDEAKRQTSVPLPAAFAEDDLLPVSTTELMQAEELPEKG